jgi:ABC-type multidrug transport system fused ATPase/permease subunit
VPQTMALTYSVVFTNMEKMRKVIVEMVNERARRFRPTFKLMGLSQTSYILGTIIYILLEATFFNAITMLVLKINSRIEYAQMPVVLLFAYSTMFFSLFISCFLRNPETAPNFASIITLFVNILSITFIGMKGWWSRFIGMIPSVGIVNYLNRYQINPETGQRGDWWVDLGILGAGFVFLVVMYCWLDRNMPEELGVSVFAGCCKKASVRVRDSTTLLGEDDPELGAIKEIGERRESTGAKKVLETFRLSKYFGKFAALKDVSFSIKQGEITCILGHNGAGKSTLINVICGIYAPSGGEIVLNGEDVTHNLDA